mgnify:CR=1 FL=1
MVAPNGVNAIPSRVTAWLDARAPRADAVRAVVEEVSGVVQVHGGTVTEESWTDRTAFDAGLAQRLAATDPDRYTTSATLAKRPGRLFIDYLRNGRGTTGIGTYSPCARPGFPIAAPMTWKQLERGIKPDAFHMF